MLSRIPLLAVGLFLGLIGLFAHAADAPAPEPKWSANVSNIEGCSCPAFCQCYFTGAPALHADHKDAPAMQYCRFNNAFKINKGTWGDEKLDGVKFWMAGDLGGDFSKPPLWIVLTFEPTATPAQRDAAKAIIAHVFGLNASIVKVGEDAKIEWEQTDQGAAAKLADGKTAELVLKKAPGQTSDAVALKNLKFWNAPRNTDFVIMPAQLQAYRLGDKPFETKDSNGFVVTLDMNSDDFKKP